MFIVETMIVDIEGAITQGGPKFMGGLFDESAKALLRETRVHAQMLSAEAADFTNCTPSQPCSADAAFFVTSAQMKGDLDRWQTNL
jgi:hypothetical protein